MPDDAKLIEALDDFNARHKIMPPGWSFDLHNAELRRTSDNHRLPAAFYQEQWAEQIEQFEAIERAMSACVTLVMNAKPFDRVAAATEKSQETAEGLNYWQLCNPEPNLPALTQTSGLKPMVAHQTLNIITQQANRIIALEAERARIGQLASTAQPPMYFIAEGIPAAEAERFMEAGKPGRPVKFILNDQSERLAALEAENARLQEIVGQSAATEDKASDHVGPTDPAHRSAKETVDHLLNGRITAPARRGLRDALDKADKPLTGKLPDGSHRAPDSKAFRLEPKGFVR